MRKWLIPVLLCLLFISACNTSFDQTTSIYFNDPDLRVEADTLYYYADKLFNGTIISSIDSSKNELVKEVRAGLLHGRLKEWTPDQVLKTDKRFVGGREDGTQKGYHTNGNLSYSYTCRDGRRVGDYYEYYPSGTLQIQQFYKNGLMIKNKIVNIDGTVIANYVLRDGRYYGPMGSANCISVLNENYE